MSCACSVDLPTFGGPINAICAAPSGRITSAGPPRIPPFLGRSSSSDSSLMRRLLIMSPWRWPVPLCLGYYAEHLPQRTLEYVDVVRVREHEVDDVLEDGRLFDGGVHGG